MASNRSTAGPGLYRALSRLMIGRAHLERAWSWAATLAILLNLVLPTAAVPLAFADAAPNNPPTTAQPTASASPPGVSGQSASPTTVTPGGSSAPSAPGLSTATAAGAA